MHRVYALLAITVVALSIINSGFLTELNIRGLLTRASVNLLVVAGLTVVLLCGHIDLSVGSVVALGGMVAVGWQDRLGTAGAVVAALVVGLLIGFINGVLVTRLKINSLLATLAMMIVVNGLALSIANGRTVSSLNIQPSLALEQPVALFFSIASLAAIAAVLVLHVAVSQTPWGRDLYIIGGSDDDGRLSGVPVGRSVTSAFMISGLTAAAGGAILSIGLDTGSPLFGASTLFTVIAAAVVGGASLFGAEGSVLGSAVGVLVLECVNNGMNLASVPTDQQTVVNGVILLAVVLLDSYFGRRRRRAWNIRTIEREYPRSDTLIEGAPP
jgi:ribose transport system permease protein